MKTAGMVLGIIGGALALIIAVIIIFNYEAFETYYADSNGIKVTDSNGNRYITIEEKSKAEVLLLGMLAGAGFGLTGALKSRGKRIIGGVLMLVAAIITIPGVITFLLLLLGGIFALIPEKRLVYPYPYPPPNYLPQQQPYPPQQQQYYPPQPQYYPPQQFYQPPQPQQPVKQEPKRDNQEPPKDPEE